MGRGATGGEQGWPSESGEETVDGARRRSSQLLEYLVEGPLNRESSQGSERAGNENEQELPMVEKSTAPHDFSS